MYLQSIAITVEPPKANTIRAKIWSASKVSLAQGLVVDHAPPTIATSYDTVDNEKVRIDEKSVN